MKKTLLVVALLALGGCAQPLVDWQQTQQQYDLEDLDKDGVIGAREDCIGTLEGANVNNVGCGDINQFTARRDLKVLFPNNSDFIDQRYYSEIEKVAEFLSEYPGSTVTIEGHSSKVGSRAYNLKLSQRRADAVRNVLIEQFGIDQQRIEAKGFGFDRPVDPNNDPMAHNRNRRVVAEMATEDSEAAMRWDVWSVGR